uniref:OTU domain-containing protein 3 n=1 Tax=Leptobrachium leishanense TaxID=445787 RepID=A0A8C5Q7U5_9ANUR
MSRKQTVRAGPGKKAELERKRDERAARRVMARERKSHAGEPPDAEEFLSFAKQLQALGLRMREVPGDGNCLFRALGDQLEGHSRNHLKHRQETVDYMVKHRGDFEPFVEDNVPFDRHVANLAQPGTFAGNDAIVAFARGNQVNVVIHQLNNPLWQIRGNEKANARELHIAYRYGEHYDSVRPVNDNTEAPANLHTQMLSKDESNRKAKPRINQEDRAGPQWDPVQTVRSATGCADVDLILQSLEAESYDIASAIQVVLHMEELKQTDCDHDAAAEGSDFYETMAWNRSETERAEPGNFNDPTPQSSADLNPRQVADAANSNEESKGQQKLTSKQRKEQQRQEKKKRQEERHRQKVLETRNNNLDNNRQEAEGDPSQSTAVKAFAALNI